MSKRLMDELDRTAVMVNDVISQIVAGDEGVAVLYEASRHLIDAGGKRLRPFIVLKSCELVEGDVEAALPTAAAIELLHTFSLVHDDIMDRDDLRRGVPTVHEKYGIPIAITAGDLLFAKVYEAIIQRETRRSLSSSRTVLKVLEIITEATIAICEGQFLDMIFEGRDTISEEEYLSMIDRKTAALLKASAMAGAVIGGGSGQQVQHLGRFAAKAGLAFQITDDLLGLTADEETLGKPVGSDIREGKRTLIVAHAMANSNDEQRSIILSTLGDRNASHERMGEFMELIESIGSIDYAAQKAELLVGEAKAELDVFKPAPAKSLLLELADFLVSRRY